MSVPTALMTVTCVQPVTTQRAALCALVIKDTLVMGKLAKVYMYRYTHIMYSYAYICHVYAYAYVLYV